MISFMPDSSDKPPLANNLKRLLGLHGLRATRDSRMMGLSPQLLSELQSGSRKRHASLSTVTAISDFFEISRDHLLDSSFEDLLPAEIANVDRYRKVEAKIDAWMKTDAPTKKRPSTT